jgi:hypothetical protein
MKQNKYQLGLIGFGLILILAACVQTTQPITNPSSVETVLASTARALAKQTEAANPITATPSLTPTETPTPTPKISLYETSLVVGEDQSALFIDHKAGIQLTIPAGWMPIRVNEEEYYKAFALDVVLENPAINEHLTAIQDVNLEYHRLEAIDIRPEHVPNGIISNFNVIFESGDVRSLEKWEQAERNRRPPLVNYKFLRSSYPIIDNGMRVLVIESWDASGKKGTIYYRGVFFSLPTGTLVLDFYTNNEFKDIVLPDFEQVINSLSMLNP